VTAVLCAISVVVTAGTLLDARAHWGYLPPHEVRDGGYWALITTTFVHSGPLHLLFNVSWLWNLGRAVERSVGTVRFLSFFLAGAFITSAIQLGVSDQTGVGMSGFVYAVFGYLWVRRSAEPAFASVLPERYVSLFWMWLIGCVVATWLKIWSVGNAAHVSGLVFGALVGWIVGCGGWRRAAAACGVLALGVAAVVPLFWAPWSASWLSERAYQAHARGDLAAAADLYRRGLDRGADARWTWENLALVYAYQGKKSELADALRHLRSLDPARADRLERRLRAE
jgi:GlpG protein